jgi:hypothetical protein
VGKYKLPNLRGNHFISPLAAFVFVISVFEENIPEFGTVSAETASRDIERK